MKSSFCKGSFHNLNDVSLRRSASNSARRTGPNSFKRGMINLLSLLLLFSYLFSLDHLSVFLEPFDRF